MGQQTKFYGWSYKNWSPSPNKVSTGDKNMTTHMLTCLDNIRKIIIKTLVISLLKYSNFLKKYLRRYLCKSGFLHCHSESFLKEKFQ